MGQRLNVSIRKNDEILASGYWHWDGYTTASLIIAKDILYKLEEDKVSNIVNFYGYRDTAIGLLESIGCTIFSDRSTGRLVIGADQDTSEANIIIDLESEIIDIRGCFYKDIKEYPRKNTLALNVKPVMMLEQAYPYVCDLIGRGKFGTVVSFYGEELAWIE